MITTTLNIKQSQYAYYNTNFEQNSCDCGESTLMSAMLGIPLPCSHLYSKGKTFPNLQQPKLNMVNLFKSELFFEYTELPSKKIEVNADYYDRVRKYVYKTIKRYSHNQNKKKIQDFVNEKLPFVNEPTEFVLGYPVEIFSLIDEGISLFYHKRNK